MFGALLRFLGFKGDRDLKKKTGMEERPTVKVRYDKLSAKCGRYHGPKPSYWLKPLELDDAGRICRGPKTRKYPRGEPVYSDHWVLIERRPHNA